MQYIESAHVELKEALTADIKKEIWPLLIQTAARSS